MASNVPQAVQSSHELLLWLVPQLDKLPRARRFTLGERIEAGAHSAEINKMTFSGRAAVWRLRP